MIAAPDGPMPRGFHPAIAARFCAAPADTPRLIVGIALLPAQGRLGWLAPMLKCRATLSWVLLAPFVGPLADTVPGARLMARMTALELLALLALPRLMADGPALGCLALLGGGAAACGPADYGLATELIPARRPVLANGWIEVPVVCAVLPGTALGGLRVGQNARHGAVPGLA